MGYVQDRSKIIQSGPVDMMTTSLYEGAVVPSTVSPISAFLFFPPAVAAVGRRRRRGLSAATGEAGAAARSLRAAAALLEKVVALRHAGLPLLLAQSLDLLSRHSVLQPPTAQRPQTPLLGGIFLILTLNSLIWTRSTKHTT